jgi:hypothetical protein
MIDNESKSSGFSSTTVTPPSFGMSPSSFTPFSGASATAQPSGMFGGQTSTSNQTRTSTFFGGTTTPSHFGGFRPGSSIGPSGTGLFDASKVGFGTTLASGTNSFMLSTGNTGPSSNLGFGANHKTSSGITLSNGKSYDLYQTEINIHSKVTFFFESHRKMKT